MAQAQAITMLGPGDWKSTETDLGRRKTLLESVMKGASFILQTLGETMKSLQTSGHGQFLDEESWIRTIKFFGTQYKNEMESIYPELVHRLEYIRSLQTNWDTYGSQAPSGLTVYYAYILLGQLRWNARMRGAELPEPEACPGPNGSIQLDWDVAGKEFELKFAVKQKDIRYVFLLCPDSNPDTWEEGEFAEPVSEHPSVRSFLSWI